MQVRSEGRSARLKRYSQSGPSSPAGVVRRQELMDLLQLLNREPNDLDPLAAYSPSAVVARDSERDLDAVDVQPDWSQVLRRPLPSDLMDRADFSMTGIEEELPSGGGVDEGNELLAEYGRQLKMNALPSERGARQAYLTSDVPSRMYAPAWASRTRDGTAEPDVRDPDSDPSVARLAKLYEALLNVERN